MKWVAGVDGFKSKWCVVLQDLISGELRLRIAPSFASLLTLPERPIVVTVDIPIGLPAFTSAGGRTCERQARRVLGPRASCVFSAVGRSALLKATRPEADYASRSAGGIGIGAQAWGLATKLREADAAMSSELQRIVYEVHPEVCFWSMNGKIPIVESKKTWVGERDRRELLVRSGFPQSFIDTMGAELRVGRDDFLDACAATWTAKRIANGSAGRFPAQPEFDERGLDQAIWF